MIPEPSFTIGIEEEYWLVNLADGSLVTEAPEGMMDQLTERFGDQVTKEFLRSQLEIGTKICSSSSEARDELLRLRGGLAETVAPYGLTIMAASTHPFANWDEQVPSEGDHYNSLVDDFQTIIKRLLICGMHVHVGIEDPDMRIELLNQTTYFLPHLLALSSSSPFWRGKNMGLQSFRLTMFDTLPRSGLPEQFDSYGEYDRLIRVLVKSGAIDKPAKIWWDLRPSVKWPTLEMRITDICTRVEDAVCIASLTRCIMRALYRLRCRNQKWRSYANILINENRWRAQRYGTEAGLIDIGQGEIRPFKDLLEELLEFIREDAAYFDCQDEVAHALTIVDRGTSAQMQVDLYEKALAEGKTEGQALRGVSKELIRQTLENTSMEARQDLDRPARQS